MNNPNHHHSSTPTNTQGSPAELRAFLESLKGKGPQDTLGAVAHSHLGKAIVQATVGCVVLLVVFTILPYLLTPAPSATAKAVAQPAEKKEPQETTKPEPKAAETAAKPAATPDKTAAAPETKKDSAKAPAELIDKLKENEIKTGKPKDPFSTNIDDLLKDK